MRLLTKDSSLKLTPPQAKYAIIFSKMTCKNESVEYENVLKIQLVEFIEIIGRATEIKYLGTDYS